MARPTKAVLPVKQEAEESQAHEQGETPDEEMREGTEDAPTSKTSRKRSPRGAKNTKAPMDGECSACKSGKPCSSSAHKDAGCGMPKRTDALTPHEYLAACDLGIQGKSRTYIRARLDATERLDLKCGSGSISPGEKCTKGSAQKASGKQGRNIRSALGKAVLLGVGAAGAGVLINNAVRSTLKNKQINTNTLKGLKDLKAKGNHSLIAATKAAKHMNQQYPGPLTEQQGYFSVLNAKVTRANAREGVREGLEKLKKRVPMSPARRRAAHRGRHDSVYAPGFALDLDQLAI